MSQIKVSHDTYVNPAHIVRWAYKLGIICSQLCDKQVWDIVVTIWLVDGTSMILNDFQAVKNFAYAISDENSNHSYAKQDGFPYYVSQRALFERLEP